MSGMKTEFHRTGEYIVVHVNGKKVPRDKIFEFVDECLMPRDVDEYTPRDLGELRDFLAFAPLLFGLPYAEEGEV